MRKKLFKILAGAALCISLAAVPMSANAATPGEAAALARSMGLPEDLIQAGWNRYYETPDLYPPEVIDGYIATLRSMNQEMINQLLIDSGYGVQSPAVTEPPQQSATESTITTAKPSGSGNSSNGGSGSKSDVITLTMPDGSTFTRISSKDFAALSLEEKRAYIATFTPEQQSVFLANLSPEDYKSLLKQLPIDNKADIIEDMVDLTGKLGLTLNVDELTDDNFVLSMKDEDGKLVAMSSAKDTVAATGYDRRGILAFAASLVTLGIAGTAVAVRRSFGRKNEE